MTLNQTAISLSALGVVVTGVLAFLFLRDPVSGMAQATHRAENLPEVMTNRYVAFCALALAATIYGDLKVIAVLFAAFAFTAFADARIYRRAGFPTAKHMAAGVGASIVVTVALLALTA
jgi:hypothetical protein